MASSPLSPSAGDASLRAEVEARWSAQVERFASSAHARDDQAIARLLRALAPQGRERALDVGCGPGIVLSALAPFVRHVTGVDPTRAMLARAERTLHEQGIANAALEVGLAESLPFEAGAFDIVITRLTLHHLENPRRAVSEMLRVLAPDGTLAIFDMLTAERADEAAAHNRFEKLRDPSHVRTLPLSEVISILGIAGAEVMAVDTLDHVFALDDYFAKVDQSEQERRSATALLDAEAERSSFLGRRAARDASGRRLYRASWGITTARKSAPRA